jgi:large subunit ribosomal protein L10
VNREEKVQAVADLQARFIRANVALIASAKGLNVAKTEQLRRKLKNVGGEFKVAKNTLTRLAVQDTAFQKMEGLLNGPTGLVFGYDDPVAVAKVLVDFAKENDKVSIKAGVLEAKVLEAEAIDQLAKMPSKEVLIAQLLGLLQAPASQLLRTMQEPSARFVRLLDAVRGRSESNA